jgi:transcriptional regulator of heat shock response
MVGEGVKIFVGPENPLGESCGTVAAQVGKHNLFAIVGPTRMDYNKSLGILEFFKNFF